ncbi:MAG TPA: thioredoxin domain-containing protein [Pseudonocardia sp.]|nr:thioredoxin domain-containing protein [Pseudonocardia sp.]
MGGASRAEKRRKQAEAERRLAAAGIEAPQRASGRRAPLLVVAAVVGIAVVVGLVLLLRGGSGEPVAANYAVSRDGAVVVAGQPSAPVTVDVYSDYICPFCERFEERYGDEITEALNAGQIAVRYHEVGLLDSFSEPPGYSTRAANAALCAADAGIWPAYHDRLFAEQPAEGGPGLLDDQLVAFGTELGAPATFDECVRTGANAEAVATQTQAMIDDPAVKNAQGQTGTPTVLVNGTRVDISDGDWLSNAIGG